MDPMTLLTQLGSLLAGGAAAPMPMTGALMGGQGSGTLAGGGGAALLGIDDVLGMPGLSSDVAAKLKALEQKAGVPLQFYPSVVRDQSKNSRKGSQHNFGNAVDIHMPDDPEAQTRVLSAAKELGFTGFGLYPDSPNMLHVDTGPERRWYNKGGKNLMRQGASWPEHLEAAYSGQPVGGGREGSRTDAIQPGDALPPLPPPIEVAELPPFDHPQPQPASAPAPQSDTAPNRPGHAYRRYTMPFESQNGGRQVGAPRPPSSLMGSGGMDILGALQNMMGGGQQQAPQQAPQPQAPQQAGGTGGAQAIKTELENQMAADPVAQQHAGDPTYEGLLKQELLNRLQDERDPGRAISAALAAAGAAISGGRDVWSGISHGVNAFHKASGSDDKLSRLDALRGLVDLESDDRQDAREDRRFEDLSDHRAETRRLQAERLNWERQKHSGGRQPTKFEIREHLRKAREGYLKDVIRPQDREQALEEYRRYEEEIWDEFATNAAPETQPSGSTGQGSGAAGSIPPGSSVTHPQTGEKVIWDGAKWVPAQ